METPAPKSKRSRFFSAIELSSYSAIGIALSIPSQILIAFYYGTSGAMDGFLVATTFPSLVVMYILTCVNAAFIPQYSRFRLDGNEQIVASTIFGTLVAFCVLLIGIGFGCNELLLNTFMPKLSSEVRTVAIQLGPLMWTLATLQIMIGFYTSLLQANNFFSVQGFAPLMLNISVMSAVFLMARQAGIWAYALGTVLGAVLQILMLWFSTRHIWRFRFAHIQWKFLRQFLLVSWPLVVGGLVSRAVPAIERTAASNLPTGTISQLSYAQRILGTVSSLTLSGLISVLFPRLSELSHSSPDFRRELRSSIHMVLFVLTPMLVFLILFSRPLIHIMLVRGAFTKVDANSIMGIMALYAPYILVGAVGSAIGKGLCALQMTKEITIIDMFAVVVYGVALVLGIKYLGKAGIPIAMSIYLTFAVSLDGVVLMKRVAGSWSEILSGMLFKLPLSLLAMVGGSIAAYKAFSYVNPIAAFISAGIVGAALYIATALALKMESAKQAVNAVHALLNKRHAAHQ